MAAEPLVSRTEGERAMRREWRGVERPIALLAVLAGLILWGCGETAQLAAARENMDRSEAEYARCVATSGEGSAACESARQDSESNERAYEQTSQGVRFGPPEVDRPAN